MFEMFIFKVSWFWIRFKWNWGLTPLHFVNCKVWGKRK